jgi:hypothetical protein
MLDEQRAGFDVVLVDHAVNSDADSGHRESPQVVVDRV